MSPRSLRTLKNCTLLRNSCGRTRCRTRLSKWGTCWTKKCSGTKTLVFRRELPIKNKWIRTGSSLWPTPISTFLTLISCMWSRWPITKPGIIKKGRVRFRPSNWAQLRLWRGKIRGSSQGSPWIPRAHTLSRSIRLTKIWGQPRHMRFSTIPHSAIRDLQALEKKWKLKFEMKL